MGTLPRASADLQPLRKFRSGNAHHNLQMVDSIKQQGFYRFRLASRRVQWVAHVQRPTGHASL